MLDNLQGSEQESNSRNLCQASPKKTWDGKNKRLKRQKQALTFLKVKEGGSGVGRKASFQKSESYSNSHPPGTKVCPPEFKTQTALVHRISGQCISDSHPWFLSRNCRDLGRSVSQYYLHFRHWMLFLICTGQERWWSQAETQLCYPGSHICLWVPFSEPWDVAVLWIWHVLRLGKRQWDKLKSS